MIGYVDATLEMGYFNARPARTEIAAKVAIEKHGITLVVAGDRGEDVRWHGQRDGQGHYRLSASEAGMEASLHRFADSRILEGFWRNGPERGFWRLHLPEQASVPAQAAVRKPPAAAARPAARVVRRRRPRMAA